MKKCLLSFLLLFPTLNLFADEAPDFYQQALNFYLGNHYQNTVENLQIYFQGNPNDWRAHQLMGYCDFLLKKEGESATECEKSLKLHGDNLRLEAFVHWLKSPAPRAQRKSDTGAYLEGKDAAQMPPPPDIDPDRKSDSYLINGIALPPTSSPTPSPIPTPKPDDIFFVRTGVGTYLLQFFFDDYNRPDVNGIPSEVDRTNDALNGLTGSAAAGIECPDHFSYFASGEWLTNDWSLMVNAQYTFSQFKIIKPYLYTGLGLNLERNSSMGPGMQVGLGAYLTLTENCDVFIESKFYGALGDLISAGNSTLSYSWADGYIPVLTGLKWSFPGKEQREEPTMGANAPGHAFVEFAGGIDVPGSKWQPAYSPSAGEKFTAGFDLGDGLVLQLDLQNFSFSGTNYTGLVTDNELLLLPTIHYYLGESVLKPYLLAGVGADFESSTSSFVEGSVVNLDAAIGAGIEMPLSRQIALFVEGKYNFIFADGIVGQDIPLLGGMRIGL